MIILGIETSCDYTAVAIVKGEGEQHPRFSVVANEISSQTEIHQQYGGIYPTMAKREHKRNLIPVTLAALEVAQLLKAKDEQKSVPEKILKNIEKVFEREPEFFELFKKEVAPLEKPNIDAIAVTSGPGLEPTLWIGVNFARALSVLWDLPLIGVDHMEGHIFANFLGDEKLVIEYPALALAVSGGHTQLILIKNWLKYELIGETVDDAAGEAFDKIARLLGLPFPGGPHIQKLAESGDPKAFDFPRPMLNSKDYNFSFSGLKTSVLYTVQKMSKREVEEKKADLAASFQRAVIDTLITKTVRAAQEYNAKMILLGGGVAANKLLREELEKALQEKLPSTNYHLPTTTMATDNAAMIAAAGYAHLVRGETSDWETLAADSSKIIDE